LNVVFHPRRKVVTVNNVATNYLYLWQRHDKKVRTLRTPYRRDKVDRTYDFVSQRIKHEGVFTNLSHLRGQTGGFLCSVSI